MATTTYKIRSFANGKNKAGEPFMNYSLTVPGPIAEKLPDDMVFVVELTSDGILYKPTTVEAEQVELPDWAAKKNGKPADAKSEAKPKAEPKKAPAKRQRTRQRATA